MHIQKMEKYFKFRIWNHEKMSFDDGPLHKAEASLSLQKDAILYIDGDPEKYILREIHNHLNEDEGIMITYYFCVKNADFRRIFS